MALFFSKDKRIILVRRIRNFWQEFGSKKIGLAGIFILAVFILMAIFAPLLSPYNPTAKTRLAQPFAMPEWITIFPQFQDLPITTRQELYWEVAQGSEFISGWGSTVKVHYSTEEMGMQVANVTIKDEFSFQNIPPNQFYMKQGWATINVQDTEYQFKLTLHTPEDESYVLWLEQPERVPRGEVLYVDTVNPFLIISLGYPTHTNIAEIIMSEKGMYTLQLEMLFRPLSEDATTQVTLEDGEYTVLGQVHGILGADNVGADVWVELVYGARISLMIGLLAALVGTTIGIIVGVIAGYLGGIVDEVSMRVVDILICLPLLPLLLALVYLYGRNIMYIVLFIGIFGWQGLARVIRSQTLSLRERSYIETAKASGASGFYIMSRHIIPNVFPVAFASLVLAVPGAILFEAALSFLGFGDPRVPTWGKMLQYAYGFGGFSRLAWWWIVPTGLAIILLCLAFVFMGYALDEVVNPRLRRRR